MQELQLVVLISGNGSNLQAIIDAIAAGSLNAKILAVISDQADAYGLQRAKAADIPTVVLAKADYPTRAEYDAALLQTLQEYPLDVIALAGFMRIIGDDVVNHYQNRLVNIHPSLLPKYPGLNTHTKVLQSDDTEHGCSIHLVTAELDGGALLAQARFDITAEESPQSLQQKTHRLEHILYPHVLQWFAENRISVQNTNILLDQKILPVQGWQLKKT